MPFLRTLLIALAALAVPASAAVERPAVLIFSHTTGYRHESIPAGIAAVRSIAKRRGLTVVASEDPAEFDPGRLSRYRAIVLLSTTTDPKNPASEWLTGGRRSELQRFVARGGGVVPIHAAADSHYHWPWYGRLVGGRFARHPDGTPRGTVTVVDRRHPATAALPPIVERVDEWYYFDDFDPTADLLMVLDPQSIGQPDVNPNPVSWTRRVGRGRLFYTALGHTTESYSEPFFLRHVAGGLDWVIARRR